MWWPYGDRAVFCLSQGLAVWFKLTLNFIQKTQGHRLQPAPVILSDWLAVPSVCPIDSTPVPLSVSCLCPLYVTQCAKASVGNYLT